MSSVVTKDRNIACNKIETTNINSNMLQHVGVTLLYG